MVSYHRAFILFVSYLGVNIFLLEITHNPLYAFTASNARITSMIHWDLELTSTQNNEPGPLNHVFVHPHLLDNTVLCQSSQR